MQRRALLGLIALLSAASTACASEHASAGSAAACMNVGPCGGELVGSWKMVNFCFDQPSAPADLSAACPSVALKVSNVSVAGNVMYNADKTFSQSATITASVGLTLPGSCLQGQNAVTCTQIEASSNQDASSSPLTCTTLADGGCQCNSALHETAEASGTYTVDKSRLTQFDVGGGTDDEDFCVKGSNLYLLAPAMMNMQMPAEAGVLSGSLVLQRQ
jgi:hypothetical protein